MVSGGDEGIRTLETVSRLINYLSVISAPHSFSDPHSDPQMSLICWRRVFTSDTAVLAHCESRQHLNGSHRVGHPTSHGQRTDPPPGRMGCLSLRGLLRGRCKVCLVCDFKPVKRSSTQSPTDTIFCIILAVIRLLRAPPSCA
jgi:hypothetical protein